jgi:hypothetical protein
MSSLKEIVGHAVERAGGQIPVAKRLGVSTSEISLWCNQNHNRFIPIDHLMDLDGAAGHIFLKYWARKCGFDLVGVDAAREAAANVFKTIGEFSKASGACAGVALEALADHEFTPSEKRAVLQHLRPVKDSVDELERYLAS